MKNKKGFTLIELLAVIVILAVLLAIAIPSVAKYINASKKSTYISNAQSYAKAARSEAMIGTYRLPINQNEATLITFKRLESALENGGIKSSYDGSFVENSSFVVIVNSRSAEDPKYDYYIAARDDKGYGIGKDAKSQIILYDALKNENVVQLTGDGAGEGVTLPTLSGDSYSLTISTGFTVTINKDNFYSSTVNNGE